MSETRAVPNAVERLVRQIVSQVRWRRAEHYALRGVFWGVLLAIVPLVVKGPFAAWAVPLAGGLVVAGVLGGLAYGLSRRVGAVDAARLADRAFGLSDRVTTALECGRRGDRGPMVEALIADAIERAESVQPRQIVRRVLPREAKLLPLPIVAAAVLVLAPPVPLPSARLFERMVSTAAEEEAQERGDTSMIEERARPIPRDPLRRPAFEERDFAARAATGAPSTAGDLSAIFKDTSLGSQRPDFNSFLKKGDERLKLLERMDRLPDLQTDFTTNQYKMVFRKSKELKGGLRPDQVSPQKLREILEEMERLGRKGGANWSGDAMEGMEALEYGEQDRAMSAMEKALNKMRAAQERARSGRNLRGGRDGKGGDRGQGGASPEDMDFGEGEGLFPGRGKSQSPKGEPSQRLRANPYDVGVEGESRRGKKQGYDTNLTGRGGKMDSRLQYLGVIGQYRKMMEDAIAREQVPRDYHTQIKDYFQALDER
ncbi:MAG: hypothetical protein HYU51_05760 [Candidatus Rokubacteria bacterium]|nr:hypothetical protein [Candidatus Rokubacteria bacterium]